MSVRTLLLACLVAIFTFTTATSVDAEIHFERRIKRHSRLISSLNLLDATDAKQAASTVAEYDQGSIPELLSMANSIRDPEEKRQTVQRLKLFQLRFNEDFQTVQHEQQQTEQAETEYEKEQLREQKLAGIPSLSGVSASKMPEFMQMAPAVTQEVAPLSDERRCTKLCVVLTGTTNCRRRERPG